MKKSIILFILSTGPLTLAGRNLFDGSGQSSDETTDPSVLKVGKADTINGVYTSEVHKDMDLSTGRLIFTDKRMEWIYAYQTQGTDSSESSGEKTTSADIEVTAKDDEYITSEKENKREATITLIRIDNYRLKDEDGNIYNL